VRFDTVRFTPRQPGDGKYADTTVTGIRLHVTDRERYDPVRTAVALLVAVRQVHPAEIRFIPRHFDLLAGGPGLREAIEAGLPASRIAAGWRVPIRQFLQRAKPVRLYPNH
ncbi:MAG TPA: hypothetical protein VFU40_05110, partial [Gemmatimonadales bacterium]|nr:hypothetical protein [Gemmatimonadales bacterium]